MSGMRRCEKCNKLFKIKDAGPEAMSPDGSFPSHVCAQCGVPAKQYTLRDVQEALATLGDARMRVFRPIAEPNKLAIVISVESVVVTAVEEDIDRAFEQALQKARDARRFG